MTIGMLKNHAFRSVDIFVAKKQKLNFLQGCMSNLYREAANVVKDVLDQKRGLNGCRFSSAAVYALACQTLRFVPVLREVIGAAGLMKDVKGLCDESMTLVLCYDLLLGTGKIAGGGRVKQAIVSRKARLSAELVRVKLKKGAVTNEQLARDDNAGGGESALYARMNGLGEEEILSRIAQETQMKYGGKIDCTHQWDTVVKEGQNMFFSDCHVRNLLVFSEDARKKLSASKCVQEGVLVIQQKASCFPVELLWRYVEQMEDKKKLPNVALDTCAAPGNKTSQLCTMMQSVSSNPSVWAFEKDGRRHSLLQRRMQELHCDAVVHCLKADFLASKEEGGEGEEGDLFRGAQIAVVDPSCSGSGIVSRSFVDRAQKSGATASHEQNNNKKSNNNKNSNKRVRESSDVMMEEEEQMGEEDNDDRLKLLSAFQERIMCRVLQMPQMQCVSYSTCSVHEQENEQVVRAVLAQNPQFRLVERARAMPEWETRGIGDDMQGCVRVDPQKHHTIGFFVALFERVEEKTEPKMKKRKKNKKKKKTLAVVHE